MSDLTIVAVVAMPSLLVWQAVTAPSPNSGLDAATIASILTFLAITGTALGQLYREGRQRKWAIEDREVVTKAVVAVSDKVDASDKKTDIVIEKNAEIHTKVDGNLSMVTSELKVANTKIEGMQKLMAEMVAERKEAKSLKDKQDVKDAEAKPKP